jgi:hypothetical protein
MRHLGLKSIFSTMGFPIGQYISKQLFPFRQVNPLVSFTVYDLSTSFAKGTEVAETPKMGSTYDCNLSKDLIDDTNLASPSAEEESGRDSTGPVATRDLPSITKTEWLEFCVDLVRAFEDYRGWKLLWYISNKDLKLKQLEDEYQRTKTGIRALRTQLRLFNEQLKYVPRCTTENFDAWRYSGVDSVPSELEDAEQKLADWRS